MSQSFHTLLIPTRNRPTYISTPVSYYLSSDRDDIRCVVIDASDDHTAIQTALSAWRSDSRLTIIDNTYATTGRVASMRENWSTGLDNVSSRWVSVIGDDDVLDPSLAEFLERAENVAFDVPCVRWGQIQTDIPLTYNGSPHIIPARIPAGRKTVINNTQSLLDKIICWDTYPRVPQKACGLYHGAVRLDTLLRLKSLRGKWFTSNVVDYDIGWALSKRVHQYIHCERPFSINGHSTSSNSWSMYRLNPLRERTSQWSSETGGVDGWSPDIINQYTNSGLDPAFFFTIPMVVYGFTHFFLIENKINIPDKLDENFMKILVAYLKGQYDLESHSWYSDNMNLFLRLHFNKAVNFKNDNFIFTQKSPDSIFFGYHNNDIFFDRRSCGEDYNLLANILFSLVPSAKDCIKNPDD
jgi:hypothetical protein